MSILFSAVKKFICVIISSLVLFTSLDRQELGTAAYFPEPSNVFMAQSEAVPLIAAHRSGKGIAPENTLMAVEECVNSTDFQIDMLEIDIQITSDGELVLYHSLYLDENSNAAEYFGADNITVFSKTYEELRNLNMGEYYKRGGSYIYQGLRGDDIPDNLRILKLEDLFDYLAEQGTVQDFLYSIEIKYPFPWGPTMVDKLYSILEERDLLDNTIVGSFWADVTAYIDSEYGGRLSRFASIEECLELYSSYYFGEDLSGYDFPYIALSLPYYEDDGYMLVTKFGKADFIDYVHQYGLAACYWTVNNVEDISDLIAAGADTIMTDHPAKAYSSIYDNG